MKKERVLIKLTDIPDEGQSFSYSDKSGELSQALHDIIDDNSYSVELTVQPIDTYYLATGKIITQLSRICSQCGSDIQLPVNIKLNEILIPKAEMHKGDTQSKSGFIATDLDEQKTDVTYIVGGVLNVEELVREQIVITDPTYPVCPDKCEGLEEVRAKMSELEKNAEHAMQGGAKQNPFEVLKKMKLDS